MRIKPLYKDDRGALYAEHSIYYRLQLLIIEMFN